MPPSFDQLSAAWTWRPIPGCPGRFVLRGQRRDLPPQAIVGAGVAIARFSVAAARDPVLVAQIAGGGLISYARPDGSFVHTLNTEEGLERKLAQLGIEWPREGGPLARRGGADYTWSRKEQQMAVGWSRDGAVQEQIDASVDDAVARARSRIPRGESLTHCEDCGEEIPEKRRQAVPGVRRCVACQSEADAERGDHELYNRRGSKGSQMK